MKKYLKPAYLLTLLSLLTTHAHMQAIKKFSKMKSRLLA